jgi:hypothetical protein
MAVIFEALTFEYVMGSVYVYRTIILVDWSFWADLVFEYLQFYNNGSNIIMGRVWFDILNQIRFEGEQENEQTTEWVQILCFWTVSITLSLSKTPSCLFFKTQCSETGFYLCLQVKPAHLGPFDRASPYLWY